MVIRMSIIKKIILKFRGEVSTAELVKNGMTVGNNFHRMQGVVLDPGHCWLIHIGDNVTLAPRVYILCHDASTKQFLGFTKIGNVEIGNNVFVGADSVILPGVTIGDNVIIGANSTVSKDVPSGMVAVGTPAKVICSTEDYLKRMKDCMKESPCYDEKYTIRGGIDNQKKKEMFEKLKEFKIGFVD